MQKYVLHAPSHKLMTSGKVREDIVQLASDLDYAKLPVDFVLETVFEPGDIILYPYPSEKGSEDLDLVRIQHIKDAGARVIMITLNIDYLRYPDADRDAIIASLNGADFVISLTTHMTDQLRADGMETPTVELGLHDYLVSEPINAPTFEKTVIFAGSPYKAPYVVNWPNKSALDVYAREQDLEGVHFQSQNVQYVGYMHPNRMPKLLTYGFGLAFDVDSGDGDFANYQTLNLSHKVSMFLAAGIPLFVNAKAAIAPTIEAANAGILINELTDIDLALADLHDTDYTALAAGSNRLGALVRNGYYYRSAILEAEKQLV
ncbi:MAG: hypothetical protein LBT80_05890 [Lactobacillaceae bacterium]|jgi:hypothetical protein|nr:hypothetical protein [Lactobacillaceae bacterium]